MSDGDTRQDKELARASLKGLTAYAEQLAYHNKNDEIRQVSCPRNLRTLIMSR